MFRQFWWAFAVFSIMPSIAAANSGLIQVTNIRSFSHAGSTRVILDTTGRVEFRAERTYNPDRLFFDISHARPWIEHHRYATRAVNDALVRRIRVAETAPGTTRIVFDLMEPAFYKITRLQSPQRMVIEDADETVEIRDGETGTGLLCRAQPHIRAPVRIRISCARCASTSAHAPAGQHAAAV